MPPQKKPKRPFRLPEYRTYDARQGFGNAGEWKRAWDEVMGHEDALRFLGQDSPLTVMGFDSLPTAAELKKRYRDLMMLHHPDKGGSEELTKKIIAAYSELKNKVKSLSEKERRAFSASIKPK